MHSFSAILLNGLVLLFSLTAFSSEQPNNTIRLGMSTALTGPASNIGSQLAKGSKIYFDHFNQSTHQHGFKIHLTIKDDGYEPHQTVNNTRAFIDNKHVDALFGYMGTPTTSAIRPILEHSQIPLLMPFTGAEFLRNAKTFKVFNLRSSYLDEAIEQVEYLVTEKGYSKIALLIQADEFGITLQKSLTQALALKGLKPVTISRYQRNTKDVARALKRIAKKEVLAIAMIGTYEPLAEFINLAQASGIRAEFTSVSFASSNELFSRVNTDTPLMVTEVVPNPNTCKAAICEQFRTHLKTYQLTANQLLFEGYLNALVFSKAILQCSLPYNEACLLENLPKVISQDPELKSLFKIKKQQKKLPIFRSYNA